MRSGYCLGLLAGLFFLLLIREGRCEEKTLVISSDMQFDYAQTLFKNKDYDTALVEYKRFIYFFPGNDRTGRAKYHIALCLFEQKKYMEAAQALNEIIEENPESPEFQDAYFYQARAFMHLGNTGYAEIVLQNYLKLTRDETIRDRIYAELAELHLSLASQLNPGSLDLAKTYLSKISPSAAGTLKTRDTMDLILLAEQAPKKDPFAAGLFSIVPGGGFLYCERYQDALVTFLLNTGLMLAAYEAYSHDNTALAGVIAFVETGFYMGNIYGAVSGAHKYNQAGIVKILNRKMALAPSLDPEGKGLSMILRFDF